MSSREQRRRERVQQMLKYDSVNKDYPVIFQAKKGSEYEALLLHIQELPQGSEERHEAMGALFLALARVEQRAADEVRAGQARTAKAAKPRRTPAPAPAPASAPASAPAPAPTRDLGEVRSWLRSNGHKVADRGRVSQTLLEEYDKAH